MDEDGHGTHCAGVIGASGGNGLGITGINWQCKIMSLRFMGPDGGHVSNAISALQYAIAMGAKVSNNSWGSNQYSQSLYDAIKSARTKGHIFVAAAGNSSVDTDLSAHFPSGYNLDNMRIRIEQQ